MVLQMLQLALIAHKDFTAQQQHPGNVHLAAQAFMVQATPAHIAQAVFMEHSAPQQEPHPPMCALNVFQVPTISSSIQVPAYYVP